MEKEIKKEIERIKSLSDFEAREQLRGYAFTICKFLQQFYEVGTKEYKNNYNYVYEELNKRLEKSRENIKSFKVDLNYKTRKGEVFGWICDNVEERSKEEVLRRIKEMDFYNLNTNRKIKPIFIKIDIKEIPKEVLK